MKYSLVVLALLASPVMAQPAESHRPELRSFVGGYVPFGAMRSDLEDAATAGVQGAFEVSSRFHILGTVGWIYGRHTIAGLRDNEAYLIDYNVGAEWNLVYDAFPGWRSKPFAGFGVGARSYDYGPVGVAATTCATGYATMGGELQRHAIALRAEARQYVTCFDPPLGGGRSTRSDATYTLGVAYHLRREP